MKRRALLIGGPGQPGKNYLSGVERDLANYRAFLCSELGGAWVNGEITSLLSPTESDVTVAMDRLKDADYSFTVFTGHSFYFEFLKSTMVALQEDVHMSCRDLRMGAKRHTLILDGYRVSETAKNLDPLANADRAMPENKGLFCRQHFANQIELCPRGLVVLHACDNEQQSAGDIPNKGGRYSLSLLDAARNWFTTSKVSARSGSDTLTIVDAHRAAADTVRSWSSIRQDPWIELPESGPYFPFAFLG